jgi:hypothetical protein
VWVNAVDPEQDEWHGKEQSAREISCQQDQEYGGDHGLAWYGR